MIMDLILLLVVGLILLLLFHVVSWFVKGTVLKIVGVIFALLFLLQAIKLFGIWI